MLSTLTDFENMGLHSQFCLADGHAYHDLHPAFIKIVNSLPQIWHDSANKPIYAVEKQCNLSFSSLIKSPIISTYENFRICPTASNSIDLIGAVLKSLEVKTILVEPTFDNLALLLKRRGVHLDSLSDLALLEASEADDIEAMLPDLKNYGAIFIVNPNNPTGLTFSETAFKNLVTFCEKKGIILVIDNCFRLYRQTFYDDYAILINSSVSFIALEDTGKVWPTQDLKASLIYFSNDMKKIFNEIYNEVYLCVSNFSLGIISAFFDVTAAIGIQETISNLVYERRSLLRTSIQNSILSVEDISVSSHLPVEWLVCNVKGKNDFTICQELKEAGLAVLPGRQFYWNSFNSIHHQRNIRVSLMKRETNFLPSLEILQKVCQKSTAMISKKESLALNSVAKAS